MTIRITQIRQESLTSLHGRPEWVDLHPATGPEQAIADTAGGGMFWLTSGGLPYQHPYALHVSDRLARVIDREEEAP